MALTPVLLFAQNKSITGYVIDAQSGEAIPYVHIMPTKGGGTLSDLNGKFTVFVTTHKNDSLKISCIGYETQRISLKKLPSQPFTIELTESRTLLPTMIVHELSAKDYVQKCVQKIPDNYTLPEKQKAFYWNTQQVDSIRTGFFESYLTLSKSKSIVYDEVLHQTTDPLRYLAVNDSLHDVLAFDVIGNRSMIANPINIDDWTFEYQYSSENQNQTFVVIEATMIQNSSFVIDKKQEQNRLKLFVDAATHTFTRIDFSYRWHYGNRYNWIDRKRYSISGIEGTVEYTRGRDNKYSLSYLFLETAFVFTKTYNYITTNTGFSKHELVAMPEGENTKKPVVRWSDYLEANAPIK